MDAEHTSHHAPSRVLLESLTKLGRKLRTIFNARVTAHGLTYARARTLLRLSEKPGMTQKELAFELELEQPTVGRLLDRMEKLDLIARQETPHDRRAKQIVLTPHGMAQAELVARIGQEIRDEMFARISEDDIRRTITLLESIDACASRMIENHGTGSSSTQPA